MDFYWELGELQRYFGHGLGAGKGLSYMESDLGAVTME
jgi:hypothetical protein